MKKILCLIFTIFISASLFAIDKIEYTVTPSGKNDFSKCKMWFAEIYKGDNNKVEFEDKDMNIIRFSCRNTESTVATIEVIIKDDVINVTYKDCCMILGNTLIPFEFGNKAPELYKTKIERLQEIIDTY